MYKKYYYYYKLKNHNENVMFKIIMNIYEKICHAYFSSTSETIFNL